MGTLGMEATGYFKTYNVFLIAVLYGHVST